MDAVSGRPTAPLHGLVRGYCVFEERAPTRRSEMPSGGITLVLTFGAPWSTGPVNGPAAVTLGSFVAGIHDRPTVMAHSGNQMGLQVDLTAVGAYALLGVAVDELANTVVPLDAVLGSAGGRLVEQVGNAGCAQARMAALDAALADLVSRHRPPSPEVTWLAGQLGVSPGDQLVRDLAGYLGWSHRHLTERFRREVGAPPKRYARLQRFRGALRLLSREPAPPLAAVAAASGYYDQAHLNREFRVLAGRTPAEVAATNGRCEEVDFVQDEVLSGAYRQSR